LNQAFVETEKGAIPIRAGYSLDDLSPSFFGVLRLLGWEDAGFLRKAGKGVPEKLENNIWESCFR
jgi:hypothetical protein